MNARIHLKNMNFYGYHGHLPEENALGQRFLVDLVMTLDIAEAARTDSLQHTVDYTEVFALCRDVVEQDRVKLLETLAHDIVDRILARFPRVNQVDITIKKPSVPVPGALDYVALETGKTRA